jgi:hypothetical protein
VDISLRLKCSVMGDPTIVRNLGAFTSDTHENVRWTRSVVIAVMDQIKNFCCYVLLRALNGGLSSWWGPVTKKAGVAGEALWRSTWEPCAEASQSAEATRYRHGPCQMRLRKGTAGIPGPGSCEDNVTTTMAMMRLPAMRAHRVTLWCPVPALCILWVW